MYPDHGVRDQIADGAGDDGLPDIQTETEYVDAIADPEDRDVPRKPHREQPARLASALFERNGVDTIRLDQGACRRHPVTVGHPVRLSLSMRAHGESSARHDVSGPPRRRGRPSWAVTDNGGGKCISEIASCSAPVRQGTVHGT